jgi:hypothetical protein
MFRNLGDSGPQKIKQVLSIGDEKLERPSLASAFLSYVERAPYNTDCFNHWRYTQTPFAKIDQYTAHSNQDDLRSTVNKLNDVINNQELNGAWPYNFGFKVFLTTFLESYDPLHNVEFFSDKFPSGDDSGRNFMIQFQGKNMSLADFWESSCGRFTKKAPFTAAQWKEIDKTVTEEFAKNTQSFLSSINMSTKDPLVAQEESYNLSVEFVYNGIEPNQVITENSDYYNKCIEISGQRFANAAYALASTLKYLTIPSFPKNPAKAPIRTSEAIGWSITCILLPLTIYLIWNYFQTKSKLD